MLEDYFDFLAPDDIRLSGSRIGVESILYEYVHRAQAPEAIQAAFPSLSLEQIYAVVLYYLRNKTHLDHYLADWLEFGRQARAEQDQYPPRAVVRIRQIKGELEASGLTVKEYIRQQQAKEAAKEELVTAT